MGDEGPEWLTGPSFFVGSGWMRTISYGICFMEQGEREIFYMSEGAVWIICAAYRSGIIHFATYCQICRTYQLKIMGSEQWTDAETGG